MSNLAVLEVSAYLLIPWVFILPWSILFHIGLWQLLGRLASAPNASLGGSGVVVRLATLVAWYLLGFGPSLFGGYLYYRQDRSVGKVRALVLGHALVLCNYVAFVSCWLAALRSLRGLTGWEKTVRRSEGGLDYLLPSTLVAASGRVMGRLKKRSPEVGPSTSPARSVDLAHPPVVLRFAPPQTRSPAAAGPSAVIVKAVVSHQSGKPGTRVQARVTRGPARLAPVTLSTRRPPTLLPSTALPSAARLTGRLRVAPRRDGPDKLTELGARFLIGDTVTDMVTALEEGTA
jgi:hypothetical protein